MPLEQWLRRLAYFDMVNFASDVKCPVIIGLGLRDYGLSPAPGIIATYAYLPGDKALGVSPWEGHCYPKPSRGCKPRTGTSTWPARKANHSVAWFASFGRFHVRRS